MSLDELYSFFETYGKVLQIFMRRFPTTRQFKGSVFVTFDKQEEMQSFLELKDLKYQDTPLIIESQLV
jgi:RNA recognition motif-containing protein